MDNPSLLVGFSELAACLNRPVQAVRSAHAHGFLPIASEVRSRVRCFNAVEAQVLAVCIGTGGDRA